MSVALFSVSPSGKRRVDPDRWVDAAPFRAHLTHLCAASGLTWPGVALHAGLTLRHADALLHGREGRPARRLPRPAAQRLWQVEVGDLLVLRRTLLPADATAHRAAVLLERGTSAARICADLGWPPARLRSLLGRAPGRVTAVEALGVRALAESLDRVDQRSPVRDARAA